MTNCTVCLRPFNGLPHATATLNTDQYVGEYHGEVRNLADGFADLYVFGYAEFHLEASRLSLSDAWSL